MTFKEIQDSVLSDRFNETFRVRAKRWINYRYARLWASEAWSFKQGIFTFPVLAGEQTALMTGLQRVNAVYDTDAALTTNTTLYGSRPEDFLGRTSTIAARPLGFTVVNGVLRLEQPILRDTTLTVLGEADFTELDADSDVPLLPESFHYMLVQGALALGLREESDPTWQGAEADFQAAVGDLKLGYLTAVRTYSDAQPAWP